MCNNHISGRPRPSTAVKPLPKSAQNLNITCSFVSHIPESSYRFLILVLDACCETYSQLIYLARRPARLESLLFPLVQGIDMYLLKSGWDLCCERWQPSLNDRACATSGAFHHISVDFISSGRISGTTHFSARKTIGSKANSKAQPTTPIQ